MSGFTITVDEMRKISQIGVRIASDNSPDGSKVDTIAEVAGHADDFDDREFPSLEAELTNVLRDAAWMQARQRKKVVQDRIRDLEADAKSHWPLTSTWRQSRKALRKNEAVLKGIEADLEACSDKAPFVAKMFLQGEDPKADVRELYNFHFVFQPLPDEVQFQGERLEVDTPIYVVRADHFGAPKLLTGRVVDHWCEVQRSRYREDRFRHAIELDQDPGKHFRTIDSTDVPLIREGTYDLLLYGHRLFIERDAAIAHMRSIIDGLERELHAAKAEIAA